MCCFEFLSGKCFVEDDEKKGKAVFVVIFSVNSLFGGIYREYGSHFAGTSQGHCVQPVLFIDLFASWLQISTLCLFLNVFNSHKK